MIRYLFLALLIVAAPVQAASIWSSTAVTPSSTDRIPVDVSASGAPSHITPLSLSSYLLTGSSTTEVLSNQAGAFDGDSGFTFNATNNSVDLGGATLTASDPVLDLSQTWNSGATTFTGLKLNVTDPASAASSMLVDLQVGGTSKVSILKSGQLNLGYTAAGAGVGQLQFIPATGTGVLFSIASNGSSVAVASSATGTGAMVLRSSGVDLASNGRLAFTNASNNPSTTLDLYIERDASGVLSLKNGANPQGLRAYDTYTDSSNYGRLALNTGLTGDWVQVAAETAGTGADDYGVAITPSGAGQIVFGTPSAAASTTYAKKAVTGIADATATAVFTVSVPNAAHSATIAVEHACSLGAGGAIGANEATGSVSYNVSVARTSGVNAVASISSAYGSSASSVAGAATITVTGDLGAVSGAVGATNTFTIRATVTKGSGASANHTCVSSARLLNANASGVTIS